MPKPNMPSSSTPVTWKKAYPNASCYNLNMLMAELLQRYMPEHTPISSKIRTQHATHQISTYDCNNEPLKSEVDAAIEDYLQRLPLGTQSQLRKLWELTYEPFGSQNAYYQNTYILCQLSRLQPYAMEMGTYESEVTLSIQLALMFTLVWRAIQGESQ